MRKSSVRGMRWMREVSAGARSRSSEFHEVRSPKAHEPVPALCFDAPLPLRACLPALDIKKVIASGRKEVFINLGHVDRPAERTT